VKDWIDSLRRPATRASARRHLEVKEEAGAVAAALAALLADEASGDNAVWAAAQIAVARRLTELIPALAAQIERRTGLRMELVGALEELSGCRYGAEADWPALLASPPLSRRLASLLELKPGCAEIQIETLRLLAVLKLPGERTQLVEVVETESGGLRIESSCGAGRHDAVAIERLSQQIPFAELWIDPVGQVHMMAETDAGTDDAAAAELVRRVAAISDTLELQLTGKDDL
jgi:hypothetical protein